MKKKIKVVYVSGSYSGKDEKEVKENVLKAKRASIELYKKGYIPLCPHTHTNGWENDGLEYEDFLKIDIELLKRCDAIYMLPGWEKSKGSKREYELAKELKLEFIK